MFRIYYADETVAEGRSRGNWKQAPNSGVQVVARWPQQDGLRWTCRGKPVLDRDLWTGLDSYDPFGWGPKRGSLIDDEAYQRIWERACGD